MGESSSPPKENKRSFLSSIGALLGRKPRNSEASNLSSSSASTTLSGRVYRTASSATRPVSAATAATAATTVKSTKSRVSNVASSASKESSGGSGSGSGSGFIKMMRDKQIHDEFYGGKNDATTPSNKKFKFNELKDENRIQRPSYIRPKNLVENKKIDKIDQIEHTNEIQWTFDDDDYDSSKYDEDDDDEDDDMEDDGEYKGEDGINKEGKIRLERKPQNIDEIIDEIPMAPIDKSGNITRHKHKKITKGELVDLFETMDIIKQQILEVDFERMEEFYMTNYTLASLYQIADYYNIRRRVLKPMMVQDIVLYESNPDNFEEVFRRRKMWAYLDELKSDSFLSKYISI